MKTEGSQHLAKELEIASSQRDSNQSKSKRGGKRPVAGRKPNLTKVLLKGVSRETILAACENVDVGQVIIGLLRSKREQSRIEALHFIFDRVMGKPKQDVSVSGGFVHAHVRDPLLAMLPREALEELLRANNEILAKYSGPVVDVSQNGQPAIEGEGLESDLLIFFNDNIASPIMPERIQAQIDADVAALERIYATDFIGVGPSGAVRTKPQVISDFKSGELKFQSITTDDVQVRIYGNTAVETGRSTMNGQDRGKAVPRDNRFTSVWVKRQGHWRLVLNHYSPLIAQR